MTANPEVMTLSGRLADRDSLDLSDWCPIERALADVGTKSALVLLREAFCGATRFEDLARRAGITDQMAAQRLKQLVDAKILAKRPYKEPGQRTRYEYVLTDTGHAMFPVLVSLIEFGRILQGGTKTLELVHGEGCGEPLTPHVQCAAGHEVSLAQSEARIALPSRKP
jgi:DNA-binding HxlR family transcriptional regulator